MNNKEVVKSAEQVVKPIVDQLGYHLIDIEFKKQYDSYALCITIDKIGGVTFEDCEKLNDALDKPLDELDPTGGVSYNLNISSAGIDRPITTPWDFDKNMGQEVEAKLYAPIKGKKSIIGLLQGYTSTDVTLLVDTQTIKLERKKISKLIPVIKF